MMFQKEIETLKRSEIEALQLTRLKETVKYCYDNVPRRSDERRCTYTRLFRNNR